MNSFTIALDLEGTLISSAENRIPRPGLFDFLEACKTMGIAVVYTMVGEKTTREIVQYLVARLFFGKLVWV